MLREARGGHLAPCAQDVRGGDTRAARQMKVQLRRQPLRVSDQGLRPVERVGVEAIAEQLAERRELAIGRQIVDLVQHSVAVERLLWVGRDGGGQAATGQQRGAVGALPHSADRPQGRDPVREPAAPGLDELVDPLQDIPCRTSRMRPSSSARREARASKAAVSAAAPDGASAAPAAKA
jgi:hypothetical protein